MLPEGRHDILALYLRDHLPNIREDYAKLGKDSVQVVVWLVGLSVGIIALVVGKSGELPYLGPQAVKWTVSLLTLVVVSGAAHRVVYHVAERLNWPQMIALQAGLLGYSESSQVLRELSEHWDVAEIVRQLRSKFGLEYHLLLDYRVSLEEARKAYQAQLDIHKEYERKGLRTLAQLVAAYTGLPEEDEERMFNLSNSHDLSKVRARSRFINRLFLVSGILFCTAAGAFVAAVVTVSACIISAF